MALIKMMRGDSYIVFVNLTHGIANLTEEFGFIELVPGRPGTVEVALHGGKVVFRKGGAAVVGGFYRAESAVRDHIVCHAT